MLLEHYISCRALSALLEMEDSEGEVPRGWSWKPELRCRLSRARQSLSKLDGVIKMGVRDVILYLTLCRPVRLA